MPRYGVSSGLPDLPSGVSDADHAKLRPLYIAVNALARNTSKVTGQELYDQSELSQLSPVAELVQQNMNKLIIKANSTLAFGKLVHLFFDGTNVCAEYADSTNNTKPAQGFVNNPNGIPAGTFGEIVLCAGYCPGIAGSAIGTQYYLSTLGNIQNARPAVAGTIIQAIGFGLGSLGVYVHISSLFIQN